MSNVKHAVIAAAGLGSRLGLGKPKCLLEIDNKPLIEYQLKLLENVEDVRVVVGFEEHLVIPLVKKLRPDAIIVRNPAFRTTSTLTSYYLGSFGVEDKCLFLDADILFCPDSFKAFINNCEAHDDAIIGVTKAKTKDAVYVETDDLKNIKAFTREIRHEYEWANICYIPRDYLESDGGSVYQQIEKFLPLKTCQIDSYEVDNTHDLEIALNSNVFKHDFYINN